MVFQKCSVIGCGRNERTDKNLSFFSVPAVRVNGSNPVLNGLSERRREAWLKVLCTEAMNNKRALFVCSLHFVSGN